ncbi:AAA family ATPase [Streptomyces avermitilis]
MPTRDTRYEGQGAAQLVRALVAGVGDFPERSDSEADQADGNTSFGPLEDVKKAVRELASALERAGAMTGGDPLLEGDEAEFMRRWRELRRHAGHGEPLVVHFAGHGVQAGSGSLYLATAGGEAREDLLADTCVSFGELLNQAESSGRPVLFMLDVCEAGQAIVQQQLADLAARRRQDTPRNVWIIGACASGADAYGARFTAATAEVLHQLAEGDLDITPTLEYVPVETLATAIDRRLARIDRAAGRPRQNVVRSAHIHADPEPQPFFRNPAYAHHPHTSLLTGMNPRLREFALGCAPGLDPLHFATRAAGNPTANDILFSGRRSQLDRLQNWIDNTDHDQGRLLVITGGPGSGKSALLGVTTCLLHPELTPLRDRVARAVMDFAPCPPGTTVLAVHARQLTLRQITDSLRHQLHHRQNTDPTRPAPGPSASTPDAPDEAGVTQFLHELRDVRGVLVVLDALDEAEDPAAVVNELLLPLAGKGPGTERTDCRVIIGTRPWWDILPALRHYLIEHPGAELDLDPYDDETRRILADDLDSYLRKILPGRHYPRDQVRHIADQLARYSDHGAFLVASLYAHHIVTGDRPIGAGPPCTVTEVFDLHVSSLASNDPWIRPVLTVLGQARGQGMPLDLIHKAALAHEPVGPGRPEPQQSDTRRALTKAAFYLRTTPDSDQRLLYRYFHQALTDRTKPHTDPAVLHRALIDTVTGKGGTPWSADHPYLLRHAAEHAAAVGNGALDELLADSRYLVHAEPDTLTPHLHHARTERGLLHAHIYRTTVTHHPSRHQAEARRDLLALDAAAWQKPDLANAITHTEFNEQPLPPTPIWATRQTHPARRHTLTGHTGWVNEVVTVTTRDGITFAVTGDEEGAVLVWDVVSGVRRHTLTGHTGAVLAIAIVTARDGTPLAVTTSNDRTVIVWDVVRGVRRHTLTGHTGWVNAVATMSTPDGTPLAVTGGDDHTVIVWDVASGDRRHTLTGHTGWVYAIATMTTSDGTALAVTGGSQGVVVWDVVRGVRRHTLTGHHRSVRTVFTVATRDGTPLAVSSDDTTVIVWDLVSGARLHTLTGHNRWVHAVATVTTRDGTPLVVTTSNLHNDHTVIFWDLVSGARRYALAGPTGAMHAVATVTTRDGTLLALTSDDCTVTVWDVVRGVRRHTLTGHNRWVHAAATVTTRDGTPLAVTGDDEGTVMVWDVVSGGRQHCVTGHTGAVRAVATMTRRDGTPLAVTGGDDRTVIVWDVAGGDRRHTLTGHTGWVNAVATVAARDGDRLAVTGGREGVVVVWDVERGVPRHTLTGHTGAVLAVATVTTPDGTSLAVTGGDDHTVIVWDVAGGDRRHTLTGHTGWVRAVATVTTPDGTPLAVTRDDRSVIVWDLARGNHRYTLTGHNRWVSAVATVTTRDGTPLAVTHDDRSMIVWDLARGKHRHSLTGHTGWVRAVATMTTPDGTPLAVTGGDDRTVIVWDVVGGDRRYTLTGHTGAVRAIATVTTRDGTPLAVTTSNDRTVIVSNLDNGQEMYRCHLPHRGDHVAATAVGFVVAYGAEVANFEWPRGK